MNKFVAASTTLAISAMMATSAFALDLSAGGKASASVKSEKSASASASASGEARASGPSAGGIIGAAGSTLTAIGGAGSAVVDGAVGAASTAFDATASAAIQASDAIHGVKAEAEFNATAAFEAGATRVWSAEGTVLGTIESIRMNADGSESVTIALDGDLGMRAATVTIAASAFAKAQGGAVLGMDDAAFATAVEQAAEAQASAS